jgi:hypothetical protein
MTVLGQPGLLELIVYLHIALPVFDHFGLEIESGYFGETHSHPTPGYLEMEFR